MTAFLADHGASLAATDIDGYTALHWAAACGGASATRALLKRLPGLVNRRCAKGETALMRACRLGRDECISVLIEAGADPFVRNYHREGVLQVCGVFEGKLSRNARARSRAGLLRAVPGLATGVMTHTDCLDHAPGHQEAPERVTEVLDKVRDTTRFSPLEVRVDEEFELADPEKVRRAHSEEYVRLVESLSRAVDLSGKQAVPFTPVVQRALRRAPPERVKDEVSPLGWPCIGSKNSPPFVVCGNAGEL